MKVFFVILCIGGLYAHINAQDLVALRNIIEKNVGGNQELEASLSLATYYKARNHDSCYFFAKNAYDLATSFNDKDALAQACISISDAFYLGHEDYVGTIDWLKKARVYLEGGECSEEAQKRLIPGVYADISLSFKELELYDSAIYYLNLADQKFGEFDRDNERWNIHNIKASVYYDLGKYERACQETERAWQGAVSSGASKSQRGFILYMLTNTSLLAGDTSLYRKSIERLQAGKKQPEPWDLEAQSPVHISLANLLEKKDISPTLEQVMVKAEQDGMFYFAGVQATNLGATYTEQGKFSEAIQAYERAKTNYFSANMPGKAWQTEKALYHIHKRQGHIEQAFRALESASKLRDSLKQEESLVRMAELEVKYESEKKSAALAQRTKERNRWLISSVILLVLAAGIFILFQSRLRLQRLYSKQKEREATQNLHLASYNAMVEGQEQERKRIAQELHDGVGGALASLKSYSQVRANKPKLAEEAAIKTDRILDEISLEVRRIAQDLMPVSLERLGLEAALADIVAQLNDHGTETQLEYFGDDARLSDQQKLMIYRIVQELCNNIRKHAHATKALIQLVLGDEEINLLVEDDGEGFAWEEMRDNKSLGLKTLEARVALLGGSLEVDARSGTGTSVHIEVKQ